MTLALTILGCGSSAGVPRVGNDWGACDPANPKNRRRRCSILLERKGPDGTTKVLVDTGPDLREQLLSAEVSHLDGVWFTHDHADHTHGIDDLRPLYLIGRKRLPIHATPETMRTLQSRFAYCFVSANDYPAIAQPHEITPYITVLSHGAGGSITALPIPVRHGNIDALCFRSGDTAYMPDVNGVPEPAMTALQGLDLLIIDALRYKPHPSHFRLEETIGVIKALKPKRAVITNMHIDLDYETLAKELPENAVPAYDGMKLELKDLA
ncbi:MBL fold metallo-hydrolase [Aestuariivirga litoralis]|uniref:MBL fold metallo-hydrolase n=1 Tax=Aestuariivirga litoralis TaxID=2650924 RepID=UPI0018C5DB36|nr:MBL fold metallo-hydrolase [Aestuariivirga litoralis]MBG1231579.1 MBL fold metallo-hydrolase [Aestuariivirga litoralis]